MGTGKWGFLLREQLEFAVGRIEPSEWQLTIDGVEGYEPYVGPHQRLIYDSIQIEDVRSFLRAQIGDPYDVVLCLDVIEHFEPSEAVDMVSRALDTGKFLIISTPKGYFPQEGHENDLERHLSWWPIQAFRKLAKITDASLRIVQPPMTTIAVLSRAGSPPPMRSYTAMTLLSTAKQYLVPERLYYKALRKTGPTIL